MSKVKLCSVTVLAAFVLAVFGASSASYAGDPTNNLFSGDLRLPNTKFLTNDPTGKRNTTSTNFSTLSGTEISFWTWHPGCVRVHACIAAQVKKDDELKIRAIVDGNVAEPGTVKAAENENDIETHCFVWFLNIDGYLTIHDAYLEWKSNGGEEVSVTNTSVDIGYNKWGKSGYCGFEANM